MTKLLKIGTILFLSIIMMSFVGCSEDAGRYMSTTWTVSFNSQYADVLASPTSMKIIDGKSIGTFPASPQKSGSVFGGWFTTPSVSGIEITTNTVITSDLTVYAKWLDACTVIYDSQGAETVANPTSMIVGDGKIVASLPIAPIKSGYVFGGWFTAINGGGTEFTINSVVTAGITVYAKWIPAYIVSFDSQGATTVANPTNMIVITGETVETLPTVPVKAGYNFEGWFTAINGGGSQFTASSVVTATITVYAKWVFNTYANEYTIGPVTFNLVFVPGGLTFPTGIDDSGTALVINNYEIAKTEVTYQLWWTVYTWAATNGYYFANAGREGSDGAEGEFPTTAKMEPVTTVNWRDAMVWCNALTEYYNYENETSLNCVYYSDEGFTSIIKDSRDGSYVSGPNLDAGSFDNPYVKSDAKGFRLLTKTEFEFAARYRGADSVNTVSGYSYPYYTQGNSFSGATNTNAIAAGVMGWYSANSGGSTHAVKGKGSNALGLFDVSGNVWEWVFDWADIVSRVRCGGGIVDSAFATQIGYMSLYAPHAEMYGIGFRIGKSSN